MLKLNRIPQGDSKPVGPKNANKQYFNGEPDEQLDKIIRETIQNSLDNPLDSSCPVKVVFRNRFISVDEIPEKNGLIKTLNSLIDELKKHKKTDQGLINEFINSYTRGKDLLSKKNIAVLQISDYNTTGLTGSIKDTTTILGRFLGSTGYFDDGGGGGGSGGLGKFAPFLASMINFCFYSSFNTKGEYLYYGWGDYFTYELSGKKYRPEINIGAANSDVLKSKSKPKIPGFLGERKELGTDVFAVGYDKPRFDNKKWSEQVAKAVIRNYYAAIIENKLTVEIIDGNDIPLLLDNTTISNFIKLFDKDNISTRNVSFIPDGLVVEAIEAFMNGLIFEDNLPIIGKCGLRIISDTNADYSRTISYLRKPRMLIYYERKNIGDFSFAAVFYTNNDLGNAVLRITEDSHHKKWNFDNHPKGREIKLGIKKFIEGAIKKVCTNATADEFEIAGTSLLSFGSNRPGTGNAADNVIKEPTATLYPGSISIKNKIIQKGEAWVITKDGYQKKIEPKKPKYVKRSEEGTNIKKSDQKREYFVTDFKPALFKNDASVNEYLFIIRSDVSTNIRRISFLIKGAEELKFITSICDSQGSNLERDTSINAGPNVFLNFQLLKGENRFVITTFFNKMHEILIS